MDIHHSYIKDFILPKIKSVIVVDYYEGIQGALSARKDFAYSDFLAKPRIRTKTEITWATDVFRKQPVLLSELKGDTKKFYSLELKKRIESIEKLVATLDEEETGAPLAEILRKAVTYIDEQSVYCADNKVVIVNWGLIPRNASLGLGSIYRNGKFMGTWTNINTHTSKPQLSGNRHEADTDHAYNGNGACTDTEVKHEQQYCRNNAEATINTNNHSASSSIDDKPKDDCCDKRHTVDNANTNEMSSREDIQTATSDATTPKAPHVSNVDGYSSNQQPKQSEKTNEFTDWRWFFNTIKTVFIFFIRKLWWLILLLAVIWGLLFMTRGCQGPLNKVNPYYSPLPKNPRLLPVEDGDVGVSPDGLMQIATDRLNIILEDASDSNMLEWAKAFKKAYPGADYEVYFYNRELNLMQIKVPSNQQEKVKNEIKKLIPDIPFDVSYETVSSSSAESFNDPDFNSESRSWYFKAIGAYDAWRTTLGSDEIIVAVVDNGFDLTHPELQGKIVGAYNVMTQSGNIRPIVTDKGENAHGTHVAATAVGNINNGTGLSGIAPKCRLMPIQVGNDNPQGCISTQAIFEGILYAIKNGADVVNVSLGMYATKAIKQMSESEQLNFISSQMKYEEQLWNVIVENARRHNCTIVVSAGNDNVVAGIDPQKRNPSTIRVSAVTESLQKANFSNYGCYPNLRREYSTVSAPGENIYNATPHGKFMAMNGTSMASPIVTGAVALLKSENRNLTTEQIIDILKRTGRRVSPKIGPLINIGNAIRSVCGGNNGNEGCDEIAQRLRKLQAEMDSLRRLCPDAGSNSDTLKYDDAVRSKYGLDGVWKSTTSLVSTADMTPIELYMSFSKLTGTLKICNKGLVYTAPLTAKIVNKRVYIIQHKDATCSNTGDTFRKYNYVCSADRFGNLLCNAKSTANTVTFNLVKVK